MLTSLLSGRLKRFYLNAIQDDEVYGKSEVREGFCSRIILLQEFIFCGILLPLSSALWNWDQEFEGMGEAAITHFILTADPDAVGRPSGTSALFIYFINDRTQTINKLFPFNF